MSFSVDLWGYYDSIMSTFVSNRKGLREFLHMMRDIYDMELNYAKSCQKILDYKYNITNYSKLKDGIIAFKNDIENHKNYHVEFAQNIKLEIIDPLSTFYDNQTELAKNISSNVKIIEKNLFEEINKLNSIKEKFQATAKESENLIVELEFKKASYFIVKNNNNSVDNLTQNGLRLYKNQINNSNLEKLIQSKLKEAKEYERSYIVALNSTNSKRDIYNENMKKYYNKLQVAEEEYINFLKDCLRKYIVYQVSMTRNIQYDIERKALIMEQISCKYDILCYIKNINDASILEINKDNYLMFDNLDYCINGYNLNPLDKIEFEPYIPLLNYPLILNTLKDTSNFNLKYEDRSVIRSNLLSAFDLDLNSSNAKTNNQAISNNQKIKLVTNINNNTNRISEDNNIKDINTECKDVTNQKEKEILEENISNISDKINNEDTNKNIAYNNINPSNLKLNDKDNLNKQSNLITNDIYINNTETNNTPKNLLNKNSEIIKQAKDNVSNFIRNIFFTKLPEFVVENQENKRLQEINSIVELAWEGKEITAFEKEVLIENLNDKKYRNYFCKCLNKIKSDGVFALSVTSFDNFKVIIMIALNYIELFEDYENVLIINSLSQVFYKVATELGKPRQFLYYSLQSHKIWKNVYFLENMIRYSINEGLYSFKKTLSLTSDVDKFNILEDSSSNAKAINNIINESEDTNNLKLLDNENDIYQKNLYNLIYNKIFNISYHLLNYNIDKMKIKNLIEVYLYYYSIKEIQCKQLFEVINNYKSYNFEANESYISPKLNNLKEDQLNTNIENTTNIE